jgi:DNA-binding beta-propeller fold protein YncE
MRLYRRNLAGAVAFAAALVVAAPAAAQSAPAPTRPVLIVGNNWDGTADVLDVPSYERIARINIVPDKAERLSQIMLSPVDLGVLVFTRTQVGEGHDQFVDDMFASKDGRTLFVSRPSFDDAVAIDLATRKIKWRTRLTGARADHAAISPDGTRLLVSSPSLAGQAYVDAIDTATGQIVGKFPSGDTPHENNFSRDGSRIFHASIGRVYTPTDSPAEDVTKGTRVFEVVDAKTLQILKKWDMGKKLAEAGHPGMSSAVRPMALSPDEKWLYFQVSFFHGFVEFDLEHEKVTRLAHLPLSAATPKNREDYILDSAHHGIAMNGAGTKLCVAGTSSNYVAIVSRRTFKYSIHPLGARTYWSTTSADGKYCYVSVAGDDTMAVFSYATEKEVARVPVGDHPQRARTANVSTSIFGSPAANRLRPPSLSLRAQAGDEIAGGAMRFVLSGTLEMPATVPLERGCSGIVRIDVRRAGALKARAPARLRRSGGACVFEKGLSIGRAAARGASPTGFVAHARFAGNDVLLPRTATPRRVTSR